MRDRDDEELARVLRIWATTQRRFAEALLAIDPTWGTDVFELAGGVAALHGRGLYVNRACAAGIEPAITEADLDELERRSRAAGVEPAIEVTPSTHPDSLDVLRRRGYRPDDEVIAFRRPVEAARRSELPDWLTVERVDGERVAEWQETAAAGWGHVDPAARRASDVFAAAAAIVDTPGLLLAIDETTGTAVGCASLAVDGGVATLGGMSTVPTARRRGVQTALIHHRLDLAAGLGCDIATSQAQPDSASARNLERHGFEAWCRIVTHVGPDTVTG